MHGGSAPSGGSGGADVVTALLGPLPLPEGAEGDDANPQAVASGTLLDFTVSLAIA